MLGSPTPLHPESFSGKPEARPLEVTGPNRDRCLRFDFTLAGADGAALLHAVGYQATAIAEGTLA